MNKLREQILLGTFVIGSGVPKSTMRTIVELFGPSKLFLFSLEEKNKFLVTFNIDNSKMSSIMLFKKYNKNTTRLHRHKETNTLYTINSLNQLIKTKTKDNILDKNFKLDWDSYKNSLIFLNDKKVNITKLKLIQIVNI